MTHVISKWLLALLCCGLLLAGGKAQTPDKTPPVTAEQYVAAGTQYTRAREYDKAVDAYRQAIKLTPNLAAAHLGLGNVYNNMGRAADAVEPLKLAVRLDPDNASAHLNLSIAYVNLRHGEEALSEAQEAKRLSPNDPRVHNQLGIVLSSSFGRLEEALAAYNEARRLNPNLAYVNHNIGLMNMRLGRYADAVEPFEDAAGLEPTDRDARFFLGEAYTKLGRYDDAINAFTKFLALKPDGYDALTNRAWLYLYAGGHGAEAAADARRFLAVYGWEDGTSPYRVIMANLGYREAGEDEAARLILAEAARHYGSKLGWPSPVINYLRGETSAEEVLRAAGDNDKKTEAHVYLGLDLLLQGKADDARTHFEWVREYGNKRFFEYPLAIAELKRMGR
ncbi:MAG: tetratricopeptide repeat protein [Pyrinomonadaceae bacterium]